MAVQQGFPVPGQVESLQTWTEQPAVGRQCFSRELSPAEVELCQLSAAGENPEEERQH